MLIKRQSMLHLSVDVAICGGIAILFPMASIGGKSEKKRVPTRLQNLCIQDV